MYFRQVDVLKVASLPRLALEHPLVFLWELAMAVGTSRRAISPFVTLGCLGTAYATVLERLMGGS